jgi:glyoxylase-like metal-dependent hydrolase (beta-lactamase superfamily II)
MTGDLQLNNFKVGDISCTALSDGTFTYPTNWIFSDAPEEEVKNSLHEHGLPTDHVDSPYTCLLLKTGKHIVLIDTGADGLAPTTGVLPKALEAAKVRPSDVTHVLLTHGHPDHIGGVLGGDGKPFFANAQYLMSKEEWDFWADAPDLSGSQMDAQVQEMLKGSALKNLPPLKPVMELVEGEKEIVPGVSVIPTPGHTPGHMAVVIHSNKDQLLHMVDAVLSPLNLENPTWRSIFDLDPEIATASRKRLLDRVATDRMRMLAYHFPFPGIGRAERNGSVWKFLTGA